MKNARAPAQRDRRHPRISRRSALGIALLVAFALVFARNAVFLIYEQSFFDSDQAILGLMAKHLAEGRAFPLFLLRPDLHAGSRRVDRRARFLFSARRSPRCTCRSCSRTSSAVSLLARRSARVRPPAVRCAGARRCSSPSRRRSPPARSSRRSAGIGPFVYIPLLWMLRDRPLWFGVVLGLGFLSREFTLYAVPVLLVMQTWSGELFTRERVGHGSSRRPRPCGPGRSWTRSNRIRI